MKRVSIIGATGSIGRSTLDVIEHNPERFDVVALAAGRATEELAQQVVRHRPALVSVATADAARQLRERLGASAPEIAWGPQGLKAAAAHPDADCALTAVVGFLGLEPTLAAIEAGKQILLANKETLVAAGELVMAAARRHGVAIVPVDSEHSALFQCLQGEDPGRIRRLLLTASGGPFRGKKRTELTAVTPEQALRHPRWQMGPKVTIDSATLMNKALEIIEARWLFDVPPQVIDVLVHPQSIVHSLVEFSDGSVMAQLGITDMKLPIMYALGYPERLQGYLPPLDLVQVATLTFEAPDTETFPSLNYAKQAITIGGTLPAVMNAANEVAVQRFLAGDLSFRGIFALVERVMEAHQVVAHPDLPAVVAADAWARARAEASPS